MAAILKLKFYPPIWGKHTLQFTEEDPEYYYTLYKWAVGTYR
jgi:hypothetical protein